MSRCLRRSSAHAKYHTTGELRRYGALAFFALLFSLSVAGTLSAHPLEPTILELRQRDPARWEAIAWKPSGALPLALVVQLPDDCAPSMVHATPLARFTCAELAMVETTLRVSSTTEATGNVWVRVRYLDGQEISGSTDPRTGRFHLRRADLLPLTTVAHTYLSLGMKHVVLGIDHLLFLAGLVWLLRRKKDVLVTVTMFTLGHGLALVVAAANWFRFEQKIVEVAIGASIVFVGRELWRQAGSSSPTGTTFFGFPFGLLHGVGFAGVFQDLGLHSLAAVAFFNSGVELGQLLWVLAFSLLGFLVQRSSTSPHSWKRAGGGFLGIAGAWITLERALALVEPIAP
ncbi:hypothetical protein HRbin30_00288 [bacterium HR30]|nr:hypothetical protein HRbin30_00288 [bacterium HR30]